MTKELYYDSAYISEFFAKVESCEKVGPKAEAECDGYVVVLDRTAFFPEQGGQGCDLGLLEFDPGKNADDHSGEEKAECASWTYRAEVKHVSIENIKGCAEEESGVVIRHLVDREIPVGTTVHGLIDWNHRFSNMQQHTGEHIFSGLVNAKFGYDNVGFHLSDSEVTMDYNGVLSADDIKELELKANQAIWDNLDVYCEFPDAEKLAEIPYRSKKELEGDVRIVTIPGVDICACCAPHVLKTGEIGMLKVVGLQNYKGGVRVNILCGKRALEYIQGEHEIISELTGMLTTSSDKVTTSVKKAFEDNTALKAELNSARESLIEYEIAEILSQDNAKDASTPENSGIYRNEEAGDIFLIKDDTYDSNMMRKFVNALAEKKSGYCGFFAGTSGTGYRFIIASGTAGKDCRDLLAKLKETCDVKGGGSPKMIQGSLITSDISAILH